MNRERWAFTDAELREPAACRGDDELIADWGIIVYRNGAVSNRYADGTAGIDPDLRDLAGADESPLHPGSGDYADNWRDVETDGAAGFVRFLETSE